MTRNIRTIVSLFKRISEAERYKLLSELLAGDTLVPAELAWRARLCTALEKAHVYPKERSLESFLDTSD